MHDASDVHSHDVSDYMESVGFCVWLEEGGGLSSLPWLPYSNNQSSCDY